MMDVAIEELPIEQDGEKKRFEIRCGDDVALLQYRMRDNSIVFTHLETPRSMERHGVAARLAKHGLDYARENGLTVAPLCPYVAYYISQHPEYKDLVAAWQR
ncbi:MAG: GNAT family N-acetyltransferase [Chloroflexota bacterium]